MWSTDDMDILKANALSICQQFLSGVWEEITLEEFQFSAVSGGLSNRLFRCSLPVEKRVDGTEKGKLPNEVLLRLYGLVQEDVSVVVREITIFMLLSESGMGPRLYGVFDGGRLEQYIPSRSLKMDDIRKSSLDIARELAKVHNLDVPINKRPDDLFNYMRRWQDFLEENADNFELRNEMRSIIKDKIKREWRWLKKRIEEGNWPVVFCHNDLQGGNILYREDIITQDRLPSILLIDFEFGSYNYRGFDIANQFCEWCFDYNTKEFPYFAQSQDKFPSDKEQIAFFHAYLEELERLGQEHNREEEIKKMLDEVMLFRMASHLIWSAWSFKMALHSSIDFAFSNYGETRWNRFLWCKKEYLTNVAQRDRILVNNNNHCSSEDEV